MARKSKEHADRQKAERLKMMENYEEPEWMKLSDVEASLQQIEAHLDQSHGGEAGVPGGLWSLSRRWGHWGIMEYGETPL